MTSTQEFPAAVQGERPSWTARLCGILLGGFVGFAFRRLAVAGGWIPSDPVVFAVAYFVANVGQELLMRNRRPMGAMRLAELIGSSAIAAIIFALLLRHWG